LPGVDLSESVPSIYQLKPAFQNLLRPFVGALARGGVTANQVTIFAAVLSIAAGLWLYFHGADVRWFLILPPLLFLRMALNAVDGMLAREFSQKSDLGAFLNELCDVVSDSALYIGFASVLSPAPLFIFALLAAISEMAGVVSLQIGASRRYDGPLGKSDRAFVFGLLALGVYLLGPRAEFNYAIYVLWALAAATIVQRVRKSLAEGKGA
jgi:CDP-diacylglycerol---glycerol-3-phosphate 3-phosphatidyltransferase